MTYLKIGGLALVALSLFLFYSWAAKQIRLGYEADQLQSQLDAKAALQDVENKAYHNGLVDGAASVKVTERVKVIYKKVPVNVKVPGTCAVSPDAIRLRNAARRDAYREAVPATGTPDADPSGTGTITGTVVP